MSYLNYNTIPPHGEDPHEAVARRGLLVRPFLHTNLQLYIYCKSPLDVNR